MESVSDTQIWGMRKKEKRTWANIEKGDKAMKENKRKIVALRIRKQVECSSLHYFVSIRMIWKAKKRSRHHRI